MKHSILLFALLLSCDAIIEVKDISKDRVAIISPGDSAVITSTNLNFLWNEVDEAMQYKLQIAKPNFQSIVTILEDTSITDTRFSKILSTGDYQWRLRAENSEYQTSYTTYSFSVVESEVENLTNTAVTLLAPANSVIFSTSDVINFSWDTVANAEEYTIQIARPNFENAIEIIRNETIDTTSFSVSNLAAQNYQWRVKAKNSNSETSYTSQNFTVEE